MNSVVPISYFEVAEFYLLHLLFINCNDVAFILTAFAAVSGSYATNLAAIARLPCHPAK